MITPQDASRSNERSDERPEAPHGQNFRGDEDLGETFAFAGMTSKSPPEPSSRATGAPDAWIGRRLGKYEIRSLLGTGGMGMVYRAHDSIIERDVAIKILPQQFSQSELNLRRFLSEAKAAGKLNHPNTVAIYEVGQEGDLYYLVMEFVTGGSIADLMARVGSLSVLEATRIAVDACRGLGAAHAVGLVHRDMKPANLLRTQEGSVKVADFGLAKLTLDTSGELTQMGHIVGTPYFMSPEQCESKPIDHRSDIYSLGATYYTLLTGENPYADAGSIVQVMYAHCSGEVLDPRRLNPTIPAACSQIVARAVAKLPEDRYQSAAEMSADLDAVSATLSGASGIALPSRSGIYATPTSNASAGGNKRPPHTIRYRRIGLVGLCALLVGLATYGYFRNSNPSAADLAGDDVAPLAAVAVPTGPPIRVGILHSLSGTMAESESPVVEATLLAIEELNRAGGLLGRPIEPIVRDGQSDPQVFAREAEDLLTKENVCTVFGCWTSASRKTVVPIFEKHNHLLVYPLQYEGLEQSPNVIYLGATPNQQIIPTIEWAYAFQRKRRFFLVGSDYIFPHAANAIIHDTLADLGAELVGEEYLPLGSYDVQDVIAKIVAAKPDVILNTINGDSNIPFFRALRAAKITPDRIATISFSIGEEELRHLNAAEMAGDYAAWSYFQSIDLPENHKFIDRFRAKYGPQRVLNDPMEAAYVGVLLWGQAVKQVQGDCTEELRKAFVEQRMMSPEGEVELDPLTQHTYQTPRIGQITPNGQFDIIWKSVKLQKPIPFPPSRTPQQWQAFLDGLYTQWHEQWSAPAK